MKEKITEINEAIRAVRKTTEHLKKAQNNLSNASGWGVVDILGGGMLSTFAKRCDMDEAKKAIEEAKKSVLVLKKELQDVNDFLKVDLRLDDFLGFADYFFDGMIADWLVQSKISKAKDQVNEAISKLSQLEFKLMKLREKAIQKLQNEN